MKQPDIKNTGPEISQDCLTKEIPIQLSMAGYNAYYHHCNVYQGRSSYAVCQHTIDAVSEGRVQLRSECQNAVLNGTCPAIKMREQEREAGKALFFIDRRETLKKLGEQLATPSSTVRYGKRNGALSQPLPTRKVSDEEAREFAQNLKKKTAPAQKKADEPINAEIAGRSLLGDAIDNLMKETK